MAATHFPLPSLLHAFLDAALVPERFAEGGAPVPAVLAIQAREGAALSRPRPGPGHA